MRYWVHGAPPQLQELLSPIPEGLLLDPQMSAAIDVAHIFSTSQAELAHWLQAWRPVLKPNGALWVSWPKKAAKVPTDVSEDAIRALCLPLGYVDIKVCAVDEVWSGLKLVIRKELR
nr:DUF3052 domain-containing protein [Massilia sp. TS11]